MGKRKADEEMEEEAANAGVTMEQYRLTAQAQQEEFEAKKRAKIAGDGADMGEPQPDTSITLTSRAAIPKPVVTRREGC
eukprot:scaffold471124_cov16-Prasinocladus_malaysianus.AAC.1